MQNQNGWRGNTNAPLAGERAQIRHTAGMSSEHLRVIVIGTSGCGKSTFAKALAASQGSRYVELDDLFWAEGWTPKPQIEFIELTRLAAQGERWVMDGNYSVAREANAHLNQQAQGGAELSGGCWFGQCNAHVIGHNCHLGQSGRSAP